MYRLGSDPEHTREMVLDDIFRVRIELLTIMATNLLKGVPAGVYQRRAMQKNALHVESECDSFGLYHQWKKSSGQAVRHDHIGYRLKQLALMVKSAADGRSMEAERKIAMRDHLRAVTHFIECSFQVNAMFLNVA